MSRVYTRPEFLADAFAKVGETDEKAGKAEESKPPMPVKHEYQVESMAAAHLLNRKNMAKSCNVSVDWFYKWGVDPYTKIGNEVFFRVCDVVDNRVAAATKHLQAEVEQLRGGGYKATTLEQEKTRLARMQADKTELELETLRGKLISTEAVVTHWQQLIGAARSKLLSMPTKLASVLIACTDLREIEDAIEQSIFEALEELSGSGIPNDRANRENSSGSLDDMEAATEFDGEPMGRRKPDAESGGKRRTGPVGHG